MESIGIVLKDIMGNSAVFIAGKEAVIVSAVSIVISVFIGILGLKLIRVWNAVIGFVAGALLGFAVTYLMGLEAVPVLIAAGVAGLVFAILNSVFKKFGAFWVCFLGMAGTVLAITNAGNWIMLAVCGAVGLIFAILAMIWFEPFVIIATALAGGFGAGMMIYDLAGLKNVIFMWIISIGITFIGIVIQFIMKSSEINKKQVRRANAIKKETSKEEEIEMARTMLIDLDDDDDLEVVLDCSEDDNCDDEGWYWFQSSGKAYHDTGKKKINGKYYMFNNHGQMLYEWIDNKKVSVASNSKLDAARTDGTVATAGEMLYYNEVEDGSRGNGWVQRDGSEAMKTDNDTDWYYIDDGDMYHANTTDAAGTTDDGDPVYVMRKKVKVSGNKYFAFNEKGQMQDGLQFIAKDKGFFYFDENGYQKTGKVASVECEDDDYTFYFTTKNGKNGIGYTGEKDGTLYFNGKRLEADDDYKLYVVDEKVYLVNTKGKIQKASTAKKYDDIVNAAYVGKEIYVKTNKKGVVESVDGVGYTTLVNTVKADIAKSGFVGAQDYDNQVAVPFIALYDGVYTYDKNLAEGWNK